MAFSGLCEAIASLEGLHDYIHIIDENRGFKNSQAWNTFYSLKYCVSVLWFAKKNNISHIHFPVNPNGYAFIFALIKYASKISLSCSVVNSAIKNRECLGFLRFNIWRYVLRRSLWIDCLSESIQDNLAFIFKDEKIDRIVTISPCSFSYAADCETSQNLDSQKVILSKDIDIAFVSRLISNKGVEIFLDALFLLDKKNLNLKVRICGDGHMLDRIRSELKKLNHITAHVSFCSNPIEYLRRSKITLSLQKYENYPSQVILEAGATYAALIATDVGDTRAILNENNSILIPYNSNNLAQAIFFLISNLEVRMEKSYNLKQKIINEHNVGKFAEYFLRNMAAITQLVLFDNEHDKNNFNRMIERNNLL